jgi:WbqC-like protein family
MKCAIMQPMYLPWAGYFNLIASVDRFYYLDDAQYERSTWQHRNRILLNGQAQFLSVPIRREHLGQPICAVQSDPIDISWRRKHAETIRYAYLRAPHGKLLEPVRALILEEHRTNLAELNIALTEQLCTMLGIETPRERAAPLEIALDRSPKIIELCRRAGCSDYLSPQGARDYLTEDRFTELSEVRLAFQEFTPATYAQGRNETFVSHLSVLDVIAWLGLDGARAYVHGRMEKH